MRTWTSAYRLVATLLLLCLSGFYARQAGAVVATQPAGPIANAERKLLAEAVALLLFVVVPVFVVTPWVAWRYRRARQASAHPPSWMSSKFVEVFIWGGPSVIVAILGFKVWFLTQALDPYRRLGETPPLEIQVVGLDWKWLFIYPDQGIATVNGLALPTGRPVHLKLTSDTVMVSLLMPRLAGQVYAMPGMTTELWFETAHRGKYLGENTQYNGSGFAGQHFVVTAMAAQDFDRWVSETRASGQMLDAARYADVSSRGAAERPLYFGRVQDGLFESIVSRYHDHWHARPDHRSVQEPARGR